LKTTRDEIVAAARAAPRMSSTAAQGATTRWSSAVRACPAASATHFHRSRLLINPRLLILDEGHLLGYQRRKELGAGQPGWGRDGCHRPPAVTAKDRPTGGDGPGAKWWKWGRMTN
jgi:hypothetical protein